MPNYGYYPQYYVPQQTYTPAAQPQNGINWVQGIESAKSYLVGAGQSVLLMDSEGSCFYIKSTDASGMPQPLRIFDYTERTQTQQTAPAAAQFRPEDYVTKDEFLKWAEKIKNSLKGVSDE